MRGIGSLLTKVFKPESCITLHFTYTYVYVVIAKCVQVEKSQMSKYQRNIKTIDFQTVARDYLNRKVIYFLH